MLRITDGQIDALDAALADNKLAADLLRKLRPEPFGRLSPLATAAIARSGVARAKASGLRTRDGVLAFVGLMAKVVADFDRTPPIAKLLASADPDAALVESPQSLAPEIWRKIRLTGSSIGFHLSQPVWSEPPDVRLTAALASLFRHSPTPPARPLAGAARLGLRQAQPLSPAGEDLAYVLSAFAAVDPDDGRCEQRLRRTQDGASEPALLVAALKLRLELDHGIWL